ncbi:MAG: hypothetical protein LBM98_12595 [Oscillospiraceae bacterium]|nr:hypothetical protein [Oscillospiraceae bacterium]
MLLRNPRLNPRPYPLCGGVPPQRRGGSPAGRTSVQTYVIINYQLSIINCHNVSDI